MNILFVVPDFYPNSTGFANASLNLIESILKYGKELYNIYVFTEVPLQGEKECSEINVIRYCKNKKSSKIARYLAEKWKFKTIKQVVLQNKIDCIFFETNTFFFIQNMILDEFKEKCIVRIHSTADTEVIIFDSQKTVFQKVLFKRVKRFMTEIPFIVSTSNYYLDFVKKYYLDDNPYKIWNNKKYGLLHNTSIRYECKQQTGKSNCFLTMGKMSENGITQKGMIDLLQAIFLLKKRGKCPKDFKLKMVGTGEKKGVIATAIKKLNLEKEVEVIDYATHEKVFDLIHNVKAIILLSRYEGQSMFITETLSIGKPIIVTAETGMSNLIIDGFNGFLVKKGDPADASLILEKFLSLDDAKIDVMGQSSKELYEKQYSQRAVFEQFEQIMLEIGNM